MVLMILQLRSSPIRIGELVHALHSLMRSARAQKGFITCGIYLDADAEGAICYEERWETRLDLEEQLRSSRFTHLLDLMESAKEQPCLEFHFVSETRGLDYVAAVRDEETTVNRGAN